MSKETKLSFCSWAGKSATNWLWKARSFMAIKTIPFSRLETDLRKTLNECAESGEPVVVEMPDQRLLAIQSLDAQEDDSLTDELLASNPKFRGLVAKSKAGPRRPFAAKEEGVTRHCIGAKNERGEKGTKLMDVP